MIHVAPSHAMLADALAQFLVLKRWARWFIIKGSHPEDAGLADVYMRAAGGFGAKIVEHRPFENTGGARRTDTGHVHVQAPLPVLTQRAPDHDMMIAADEAGIFADQLAYQTWDARPVAGLAGLVPRSWDPAMKAWGASQFQGRFRRLAHHPMREKDYWAWLAMRMVGEAATRARDANPARLRALMLSSGFEVAGFKGQKPTIRDQHHQLRQPILLTTGAMMTSVSPQDGFLHQVMALDTLGLDRPETTCAFQGIMKAGLMLLTAATPACADPVHVTNERGNDVTVIDSRTMAVIGRCPAGARPRGITLLKIFVALGPASRVAVIDGAALDKRIFNDRRQSLCHVCELPVIVEQRLFALGRAIAGHLPTP